MSSDKVLLIVKDSEGKCDYHRVHFDDRVEFWSKDMNVKLGESKVEPA